MDYELRTPLSEDDPSENIESSAEKATFRLTAQPVIDRQDSAGDAAVFDLPRSYGTQTLTLMARDPHTLFAYWDIDWPTAFKEQPPTKRAVFLRLFDSERNELASIEVEPMAGNSYLSVPEADTTYSGEIGYFESPAVWNKLAASEVVSTPADTLAETSEADFATVPFHLSFQHMVDLLRIAKQENESLSSMLADLRTRAASAEEKASLSTGERELAQAMDAAASNTPTEARVPARSDYWTEQRIERILGIGGSSPANGFGGSSRSS